MKIRNMEFDFDVLSAADADRLQDAVDTLQAAAAAVPETAGLGNIIRANCAAIDSFLATILGEGLRHPHEHQHQRPAGPAGALPGGSVGDWQGQSRAGHPHGSRLHRSQPGCGYRPGRYAGSGPAGRAGRSPEPACRHQAPPSAPPCRSAA